jgi:hypothetical protein
MILGGCDTGPESLFDPDRDFAADPVISQVQPSGSALAGVDVLTITGQNFSDDPDRVRVYFGDIRAEVLEVSATQIRVRAPNVVRPSVLLRVMVLGAENFSNGVTYALDPAAVRHGGLLALEEPFGLTTDDQGNVYVSMFSAGVSINIKRITPDGSRSDYFTTPFSWTDLEFGPDGVLYGVRGNNGIFRLPEGQPQQTWHVLPSGNALVSLVFHSDGALWTAATGGNVFRVLDGQVASFSFPGQIRDIAIFDDHLYVALTGEDGVSRVVRAAITGAGQLGPTEEHANIAGPFGTEARRLAFAADGSLLVGTGADPSLILVAPDGSAEIFYQGIVTAPVRSMAWGAGPYVYATARVTGHADSRTREFHDLIRIDTRREGA